MSDIPTPPSSDADAAIETVQMTTDQILAAARELADAPKAESGVLATIRRGFTNLFKRTSPSAPTPAPAAFAKTDVVPPPTTRFEKGTPQATQNNLNLASTSSQRARALSEMPDEVTAKDALAFCESLVGDPTQNALTCVVLKKNFKIPLSVCDRFFSIQGLSVKTKQFMLQKIDPRSITDRGRMCFLLATLNDDALIGPALRRFNFEINRGVVRVDMAKLRERLAREKNAMELLAQLDRVERIEVGEGITWEQLRAHIVAITEPNIIAALFAKVGFDLVRNTPQQ